jgi:hypothetical protein
MSKERKSLNFGVGGKCAGSGECVGDAVGLPGIAADDYSSNTNTNAKNIIYRTNDYRPS